MYADLQLNIVARVGGVVQLFSFLLKLEPGVAILLVISVSESPPL